MESELQINESRNSDPNTEQKKISRRNFIRFMGNTGAALLLSTGSISLLTACLKEKNSDDPSDSTQELTDKQRVDIAREHVIATSEARTPQEHEAEMNKIPEGLTDSAIRMEIHYEDRGPYFTSATVLEIDRQNKVIYILTAGHSANDVDIGNKIRNINLNQVHKHNNIQISPVEIGYSSTFEGNAGPTEHIQPNSSDQGVLAIKINQDFDLESFGIPNLDTSWEPNGDEDLHALSFTTAAENQEGVYPLNFSLSTFPDGRYENDNGHLTVQTSISQGASGSLVVTEEGKGIGIIVGLTINKMLISKIEGTDILMEQALNNMRPPSSSL